MRPGQTQVRRAAATLAVLALVTVPVLGACGDGTQQPGPAGRDSTWSPRAGRPSPASSIDARLAAPRTRRTSAAQIERGTWLRPPYREYRLRGNWSVWSYTDQLAALTKSVRGRYPALRIHLMRLSDGAVRPALSRPLNARFRFEIANVAASDDWLVWEEVGPGDDLEVRVPWRLYAARLDPVTLTVGAPRLLVNGHTASTSRPLIDVDGDRLAWMVNVRRKPGRSYRGELQVVDLRRNCRLFAWQAGPGQVLSTPSLQGDQVWANVTGRGICRGPRLLVFTLPDAEPGLALDLDEGFGTNHWQAVRDGRVAWSAFTSPDAPYPTLYVRTPDGVVQTVADQSSEPTFVGGLLFYERDGCGSATDPAEYSEIWAYDIAGKVRRPLIIARIDREGQWLLGVNESVERRTLVVTGNMWWTTTYAKSYVKIRVYRLGRRGSDLGESSVPAHSSAGSNMSFSTPQSGQTQSSGRFSQAVPGSTPLSGSPSSGS
jgi:hypothetical protein